MQIDVEKLKDAFGLAASGSQRVKLGPGVVGNTTTAVISGVVGLAIEAVALSSQPLVMFGVMGVTLALFLTYLIGTWRFAAKNPDLALMGGAELLQLRQLQMAVKGLPELPSSPPTTDPTKDSPNSGSVVITTPLDPEEAD